MIKLIIERMDPKKIKPIALLSQVIHLETSSIAKALSPLLLNIVWFCLILFIADGNIIGLGLCLTTSVSSGVSNCRLVKVLFLGLFRMTSNFKLRSETISGKYRYAA